MNKYLSNELVKSISKPKNNMIEELINICESFYNKPVHNLQDLKNRNTKIKGDIFEEFCYRYMKICYQLKEIWYYNDVPIEIKEELNLPKNDMGIDFIGINDKNEYYAIQAKYRKRKKGKKTGITWKQLSTFYALVLKTGPYKKHIIFTNADYVRHIGKKTKLDQTINYNVLSKVSHFDWMKIANLLDDNKTDSVLDDNKTDSVLDDNKTDSVLDDNKTDSLTKDVLTLEQIRLKRLLYFEKINNVI